MVLSGSSGRFGQVWWNVYGCFSIDGFIEKSESSHVFPVFQCLPAWFCRMVVTVPGSLV